MSGDNSYRKSQSQFYDDEKSCKSPSSNYLLKEILLDF